MHRLKFRAVFKCEFCNHIQIASGYESENFHNNTLPEIECNNCKLASIDTVSFFNPKYSLNK